MAKIDDEARLALWCYAKPDEAAAEIERLRTLLKQASNYVDKDHHGMLAEIDAALRQP